MDVRGARATTAGTVILAALSVVGVGAGVAGALLAARAAPYASPVDLALEPLVGASYAAVALVVIATRLPRRGVVALVLVGLGSTAGSLSLGLQQLSWAWVAIGALADWTIPAAGWLVLVVSRGEFVGRAGRLAVSISGALVAASTALTVLTFDPASWEWCRCVVNPFSVTSGPAVHEAVTPWLGGVDVAAVAITLVGVALEMAGRPGRLRAVDILLAGVALALGVGWLLQGAGVDRHLDSLALLVLLGIHLSGAARHRPSRAHVADLLLAAREESDPERLRELVARALGDPDAVVWWWDRHAGAYRDSRGAERAHPGASDLDPTRVLRVGSDDRPVAVVVTGHGLVDDPSVLDAVAEALRLSTENRRLSEELQASLTQVRESRARIIAAEDEARKRIERNLHDGAQQLLISTGVKLNLASSQAERGDVPRLAETLDQASTELGRALAELRQLAAGITPTALVHGRLADALEELALRSPVPTSVRLDGAAEPPAEVSATAYFVVAEALTNVAKHARAERVRVSVELRDPLRVTVSDDGRGGADVTAGSGLRGLADRVEARGGALVLESTSAGTTVAATLPWVLGEDR